MWSASACAARSVGARSRAPEVRAIKPDRIRPGSPPVLVDHGNAAIGIRESVERERRAGHTVPRLRRAAGGGTAETVALGGRSGRGDSAAGNAPFWETGARP